MCKAGLFKLSFIGPHIQPTTPHAFHSGQLSLLVFNDTPPTEPLRFTRLLCEWTVTGVKESLKINWEGVDLPSLESEFGFMIKALRIATLSLLNNSWSGGCVVSVQVTLSDGTMMMDWISRAQINGSLHKKYS